MADRVCANTGDAMTVRDHAPDGLPPEAEDELMAPASTPAELDPPPGARRGWLEAVLGQHALVVLIFYRGFW